MDIHAIGGGIHFTVGHTREASEEMLLQSLKSRLARMLRHGSTTIEAKSGVSVYILNIVVLIHVL